MTLYPTNQCLAVYFLSLCWHCTWYLNTLSLWVRSNTTLSAGWGESGALPLTKIRTWISNHIQCFYVRCNYPSMLYFQQWFGYSLLALCQGNPLVTSGFPHKGSLMNSHIIFEVKAWMSNNILLASYMCYYLFMPGTWYWLRKYVGKRVPGLLQYVSELDFNPLTTGDIYISVN